MSSQDQPAASANPPTAASATPSTPPIVVEYEATQAGDFWWFLQYTVKAGYTISCKVRRMTFKLPYDNLEQSGFLKYMDVDPNNLWEEHMLAPLRAHPRGVKARTVLKLHSLLEQHGSPANVPMDEYLPMYTEFLVGCTQVEGLVMPREWIKEGAALSAEDRKKDCGWSRFPLGDRRPFYVLNTRVRTISAEGKSVLVGEPQCAPASWKG